MAPRLHFTAAHAQGLTWIRGPGDSEERMAEIRIERKRRGLGLLWLFLALVLVALLAWYFLYPGRTTTAPAAAPPTTGALDRRAPMHGAAVAVLPLWVRSVPAGLVRPTRLRRVPTQSAIGGRYGEEG
jgi:hypothetical protein